MAIRNCKEENNSLLLGRVVGMVVVVLLYYGRIISNFQSVDVATSCYYFSTWEIRNYFIQKNSLLLALLARATPPVFDTSNLSRLFRVKFIKTVHDARCTINSIIQNCCLFNGCISFCFSSSVGTVTTNY
jgi:hypothetical protein